MLDALQLMDVLREGIWAAFSAALPILAVALITGLAIGLFQALTSVQEQTLTFVPKLGAIAIMFWVTMGYMTELFVSFYQDRVIPLIAGI